MNVSDYIIECLKDDSLSILEVFMKNGANLLIRDPMQDDGISAAAHEDYLAVFGFIDEYTFIHSHIPYENISHVTTHFNRTRDKKGE